MIRPKFCLVAEGLSRDADTNVVSIFNILEVFVGAGFPFYISHMAFIVLWEREAGDGVVVNGQFRIKLNNEQLFESAVKIDFQGFLRTRSFLNLAGLVIPRPGLLLFELTLGDEGHAHAEYSISVEAAPAQANVEQPNPA